MSINKPIEEYFLKPQDEYLNLHIDEVKKTLMEQTDKVVIDCREIFGDDLSKKRLDPKYLNDEYLSFIDNGIKILTPSTHFFESIKENIPRTIKELTIPKDMLKDISFLSNFPNLETLTISDYSKFTVDEIKYIKSKTSIKEINLKSSSTFIDIKGKEGFSIIDGNNKIANYEGLTINYKISPTWRSFLYMYVDTYEDLSNLKLLYDKIEKELSPLSTVYMQDLESSNTTSDIQINFSSPAEIESMIFDHVKFKKIANVFNHIKESTIVKTTKINCDNQTYEDIHYLKPLAKYSDLKISYEKNKLIEATYEEFINMREAIDYYKDLIESSDLSQLEKVAYVYDILKTMKYQENEDNKDRPRQIHSILEDGTIVCVGYSEFAKQLLTELGIRATSISTTKIDEVTKKEGYHQRNLVRVDDEKYNIHGLYAFDVTWDSDRDVSIIEENGEKIVIARPTEEDKKKIIEKYDNLILYRFFLTPMSEYEQRYENEINSSIVDDYLSNGTSRLVEEVRNGKINGIKDYSSYQKHQELFDSTEGKLTIESYINAKKPSLETFTTVLNNVRKAQGYNESMAKEDVERTIELHKMLYEQSEGSPDFFFKSNQTK